MMELFKQKYCGEELADVERDVSEALDGTFNPVVKQIPMDDDMHQGTFTVTITWEKDS